MGNVRQIIHVDMDAFYASVEQRDRPELAGKPLIVGGDPKARGVVSAASYEARRFGVHSAMPMARALRLCPEAVLLPVRMSRYVAVSREIQVIFERYTPLVEPLSLDEAFLDVTGSVGLLGGAEQIGRTIKKQIKAELGLIASAGVAPNKFLAKLASDLKKPDGFVVITDQNKQATLDPLPVGRIWGIGKVTAETLHSYGIRTIGQLRQWPLERLQPIVGNHASELLLLAGGVDNRPVERDREAKSISSEETFAEDVADRDILWTVLLGQVENVAQRLRAHHFKARTVTVKLRYADFTAITRRCTLARPTDVTHDLHHEAEVIFQRWWECSAGPLRLIGFGVSRFAGHSRQGELFVDPEQQRYEQLDKVVDQIRRRYGRNALKRGI